MIACWIKARKFTQSGSLNRGFSRWLKGRMAVEVTLIDLPVAKSRHDGSQVICKWAVLEPSKLADYLAQVRPNLLFPSEEAQREYWRQTAASRPPELGPLQGTCGRTIPVVLHGDEAPGLNDDSTLLLTWSCGWMPGERARNTWQSKFPFAVVQKSRLVASTIPTLLEAFVQMVNTLCDRQDGLVNAILVGLRCDLKWRHEVLCAKRWYNCRLMCDCCLATKAAEGVLDFRNLLPSSPWNQGAAKELATLVPRWGSESKILALRGFHDVLPQISCESKFVFACPIDRAH